MGRVKLKEGGGGWFRLKKIRVSFREDEGGVNLIKDIKGKDKFL